MDHPAREPAGSTAWGPMRREVFDRSRIAVIQRDLSNHVIYANAAALAMCGVKEVQDLRLDQVFAGEAGRVLAEETRHRRQGELGAYRVTLTRQDDPGRQVAVEVTGLPVMDEHDAVVGSLGFFRSLQYQALGDDLRAITLRHAGHESLLPLVAQALHRELPFDLMFVSRVVEDRDAWEFEIVFNYPPFEQQVPTAWYALDGDQRAFMEATEGGVHDFEQVMSNPPWSSMAEEPICRQMAAMNLKTSMWRRITRGEGDRKRTVAIMTLLSRTRDAYDETHLAQFNQLPLVEAVLCSLDFSERARSQRQLRMFRDLNRCVDIQGACRCLADALVEIFDWSRVSLFRIDSAREKVVRVASARRGDDGLAIDTGASWGDYQQHVDEGVLGRVVRTLQPQKVPDVRQDPDYIETPDGESIRSELAVPIVFSDGERVRFIINVDDPRISAFSREHVRQLTDIAQELAGAMERISDLTLLAECVDNASDPIIATDARLRIRRVNRAAEMLFDCNRSALIGKSLLEYFEDPRPLEALLDGTEAGERIGELTVRIAPGASATSASSAAAASSQASPAFADPVALQAHGSESSLAGVDGMHAPASSRSVFVTRRDFPERLGGHVFVARDLAPIRRSVQLEFLEQTAYELAVETQAPLSLAMAWFERQIEASMSPTAHRAGSADAADAADAAALTTDLVSVLRQLGRVKHAFTRLAMYNREARNRSRQLCTIRLDSELHALLAGLTVTERAKVQPQTFDQVVEIEADHTQLHIVVESLLSGLLRAAPETGKVLLTLVPDDQTVFLRLQGKMPPGRRRGNRFGSLEAAQADIRLAHPLISRLMKGQNGSFKVNALPDDVTEFVLGFPRGGTHG
ncbi:GAF domain-containing protein [Roseateles depolymerans]|uniref:Uncharacterized protein n=1 Tax=Roseateles depolymerans TaxID=76731 RepID=A0A0U3NKX4_9BURK|nr:GAF domain-containing protein [Roseateles depolymerans]ALV09040.1 hypothetical protein RD2015_4599 [Roseateles depolymerans]REG10123.1 PAS domain-containing protein [Roseateles depolymerans]